MSALMIQGIFSKFLNHLLALTLILRLKAGGGKKNIQLKRKNFCI